MRIRRAKKSFTELVKFADPLCANAEARAWVLANTTEQADALANGKPLQPTRALFAKMMADPLFAKLKFPEAFRAYVNRFYFMSDDDGDLMNLRFKTDPYMPWCIVFNMLAAAATAKPQPGAAGGDAKAKAPVVVPDASALYAEDMAKIHAIYDEKYTPESKDQIIGWVENLREGLLWKEKIHIGYTLNHYFLRLVIVECTRRIAAAVNDGTGVFGYSPVDGRYIALDDIWQCEFPVLTHLLKPPYATKKRGAAGKTADALGAAKLPRAGEYKQPDGAAASGGAGALSTSALMEYKTEIGAVASVDDAVAAWRQHLWVRGLMRKMYIAFPPPPVLGGKRKIKIATAADVSAVRVGEVLSGLGCSPGQAVGRARVVQTLEEAGSVQRGEVLITRYTQPSWTPLFSLVVAVVLEEGGMLSHAAVVSRECGVPSVVQLKDATKKFSTGQLVLVDGTNGTVSLAKQQ